MAWYAKPSGGYAIDSDEAGNNMFEIYNLLSDEFTIEAICGILGNMGAESGYNPWRWQNDRVSLTGGYGLVQFTPASGYINDYGRQFIGYAPNMSVSYQTQGADPRDGMAQTYVIKHDSAGKYLDRRSWCDYYDLSNTYPFSRFKQITDIEEATIAWLFNYEAPKDRSQAVATARYNRALTCYTILTGDPPPQPPEPPYPPDPPEPPYPPPPHPKPKKLPFWMYLRKI